MELFEDMFMFYLVPAHPEPSAAPVLCCTHHGDHQNPSVPSDEHKDQHDILELPSLSQIKKKPIGIHCFAIFYILFSLVVLITALAELIVSATNTIVTRYYNSEASNRVIGTVILSICAAVASLVVIYSIFAICKKNSKAIRLVSTILSIIVIIQVLLLAFAVPVKRDDIQSLETSLTESFIKAENEHVEAHIEFWDEIQSSLKCCGLHGPRDYRKIASPNMPVQVPFSCCPTYKKNETSTRAKLQRDLCILNHSYYNDGCSSVTVTFFQQTTRVTVGVSILLIVLEIIVILMGFYISRKSCAAAHSKKVETKEATAA